MQHLTRGLELLATLPETPARDQQELDLQLALGPALMATKGFTAPEVEQTYARARALCAQVGETPQLFPTLWGLWRFYRTGERYGRRGSWGNSSSGWRSMRPTRCTAWRRMKRSGRPCSSWVNTPPPGCTWSRGSPSSTRRQQRAQVLRHDAAPGVRCLAYAALTLWCLGYSGAGRAAGSGGAGPSAGAAHPFSLTLAQFWAAWLHHLRRDVPAVQAQAEALLTLATAQGFPLFVGYGTCWRGWVLAMQGQGEAGLAQLRQGLAAVGPQGRRCCGRSVWSCLLRPQGTSARLRKGCACWPRSLTTLEANGQE